MAWNVFTNRYVTEAGTEWHISFTEINGRVDLVFAGEDEEADSVDEWVDVVGTTITFPDGHVADLYDGARDLSGRTYRRAS